MRTRATFDYGVWEKEEMLNWCITASGIMVKESIMEDDGFHKPVQYIDMLIIEAVEDPNGTEVRFSSLTPETKNEILNAAAEVLEEVMDGYQDMYDKGWGRIEDRA